MARKPARTRQPDTARVSSRLNGQTLTDTVRVGATPPLPGITPLPGSLQHITTHLTSEYVSAGGYAWYANLLRSLPWSIDDITRDFGDDLYERMSRDAQVSSLITYFKAAMLEDQYHLLNPLDADDPQYETADRVLTWCQAALDRLRPNLASVLWDMADAVLVGNRIAELVWELAPDADGRPALLLKAIKPKPRHSVAFVTDAYYTVIGVTALTPGMPMNVLPDLLISDLSSIPNFLPREKLAVLSFRVHDCDPRGTSIARPAYNAWNLKMQAWPEYLKYLTQFASPSVIGYTAEDAGVEYADEQGNTTTPQTPEQAMVTALTTLRNGAVLAFPAGSKVDVIANAGNGDAFTAFIDLQDRQMAKAILSQTLATEEGKHQTRAASGSHQDIVDTLVRQSKRWVEAMIVEDILTPLLRYNHPAWLSLIPRVSLGRTEQRDFASTATGIAALETAGYLGESQRPGIDELLGLPERDPVIDQAAEETAVPPALPAPVPVVPGGAAATGTPASTAPSASAPVKPPAPPTAQPAVKREGHAA